MIPTLHHTLQLRPARRLAKARRAVFVTASLAATAALAQEAPVKLTAGHYQFSGGATGVDINVRHSSELGNAWAGYFESTGQGVQQWRSGWDHTLGERARITPSLQIATQGFVGGSLQAEMGAPWFVGVGLGRTNLQPYWNLNFDPNDSYTVSAGHRADDGRLLAVQLVQDNRLNPDQRHVHWLWRQPLPEAQRFTLDLLYKEGLVEGEMIRRWGVSLAYDWPRWFMRLAYDPKANFGTDDLWRLSVGARF